MIPGGQTVPTPKNQPGHEHSVAMMHAPSPLQQAPYSRVAFHSHGAGTDRKSVVEGKSV